MSVQANGAGVELYGFGSRVVDHDCAMIPCLCLYRLQQWVGLEDHPPLGTVGAFNASLNVPPTMIGFLLGLKFSLIFLLRFLDCSFKVFPYYPFALSTHDLFHKPSSLLISLVPSKFMLLVICMVLR